MNGLVFVPTSNSNQTNDLIVSNSFWPSISIEQYRQSMSVDNTVIEIRVRMALIDGIAMVNKELTALRLDALEKGLAALSQIDDEQIDGVSIKEHRYIYAVHCYAHVNILEKYSTYSATGGTAERADAKQDQADDYRRNGHAAIADILGQARCDSELI